MTELIKYNAGRKALAAAHRVDEVKDIPFGLSGVYIFRDLQSVLYVGKSQCLRRRLMTHERRHQLKEPGDFLEIIPCDNHKEVERLLIRELEPLFNWTPLPNNYKCAKPLLPTEMDELIFGDRIQFINWFFS